MSIYDNFRAPQYVDFAGIHNGDTNTDTSSFFDRDTDMLTPSGTGSIFRGSSVSSFNGTFSDGEATLTPSKFNSSTNNGGNQASTPQAASVFIKLITPTPSKSVKSSVVSTNGGTGSTFNESPSIDAFNIPSHKVSTPMVRYADPQVDSKGSCASPLRRSSRFTECNTFASKVSSPSGKSPKHNTNLSGNATGNSRRSRCSGVRLSNNRRSRSACSPQSTEEILNDAMRTLSVNTSHKKPTGVVDNADQSSSPAQLLPDPLPTNERMLSAKPLSSDKGGRPKRKLSPPPKYVRDFGQQQPEKYISMAEQVAKIQKQTPKRFRTLPSTSALKRGVQLKVARNLSTEQKPASMPSVPKKLKGQEASSGDDKGVRVARWPKPKVEPFVLSSYKKKELPKTVFNFDQKDSVLLRDRKTPCKRVRQTTEIQPFSFDKRDQELLQRKINRIAGVDTQSHCQTKARRRSRSQGDENCRNMVKDPLVHHARVPTVLHKPPFVPQKKPHKVTRPIDLCLNTEKRAKEREEFDEHLKHREMERLSMLNKLQEEKRLQEEKEIQKLRKEMVHKARPVPVFHPFTTHPSDAPLTDPCTPTFVRHFKPSHDPKFSDDAMES